MFTETELSISQIIDIDKALEEITQQAMRNGRLAYKLGRFRGYTVKVRTNAEKAQQDLFRSLGEQQPDGRIIVPKDKTDQLQTSLDELNESTEMLKVPELKMTELEDSGVYLKPSFFQAMGDLVELDEPAKE